MSKAVQTLLTTAGALLAANSDNIELKEAISGLEGLENPTHTNAEYVQLKKIVNSLQEKKEEKPKEKKEEKLKVSNAKLYAGVKMIGNKYYCKKDNYKKGFPTAKECGEHFNI